MPVARFMDTEKISSAQEGWKRCAHMLSEISNPLFVALPTFGVIAWMTAPDVLHAFLWWLIAVGGISLAPFFFVLRGVRKGRYSDRHVSKREQRLVPLLFALGCVVLAFLLLFFLGASRPLVATVTAVLVALLCAALITRFWKVSLHLVGMAGAVTVFCLLFGPRALLLTPLVLLVGWARWQVRAHTVLQACVGAGLAVVVTVGVFWLFGII